MENTLNPPPTFHRKPENNMGYSMHDHETATAAAAPTTFRCNKSKTHWRRKRTRENKAVVVHHHHLQQSESSGDEEEEEDQLEKKIVSLQRIVPGGESLGVDKLFEETAEYILALQCQIKAMRVLANFIEGLEKEKMKLGG